jgi:diaminohydroxyphosphoribosylaminopyrimidine deaminase / 5-amino-6-(5-phosphoribosylamino)uracil reductase
VVDRDSLYMRKALALAERGRGRTSPNPMVGALVVDNDGVIIGRGAHQVAGGPHAEVIALEDAGDRARGATLYCTLEPCSHTGRTGPCAPLVAAAGIRRAVIALEDPNPLVDGRGLAHLRERGIDVVTGVERAAAARQNATFLTNMRTGRPHVIVKAALSVDGRIAAAPGVRTRLTGAAANRRVHRQRAEVDALAVGSETVLVDDPLLTPRGAYRSRPLTRVIFDRRLRTPPSARVLSTLDAGPVLILTTGRGCAESAGAADRLRQAGAVILVPTADDIGTALRVLRDAGIGSLLLEGGPGLHRAALDAAVVDEVHVYITPAVLGPGGVEWVGEGRIAWEWLSDRRAVWLGDDLLVEGLVQTHVHRNR